MPIHLRKRKIKIPDKLPREGNYLSSTALKIPGASNTLKVEIWNAFLLRSGIKIRMPTSSLLFKLLSKYPFQKDTIKSMQIKRAEAALFVFEDDMIIYVEKCTKIYRNSRIFNK